MFKLYTVPGTCALASHIALEEAGAPYSVEVLSFKNNQQSSADYLALALEKVRPRALIVVDNIVRGGALADLADDEPRVVGSRRVVEAIAAEPRLLATGLQTVGVKGWDGMLLALVRGG